MRVVSWNIRRGREPGFLAGLAAIVALEPDVVLLQEVDRPPAGVSRTAADGAEPDRQQSPDQIFATKLGGFTTYFPTIRHPERGDYGLAIVTREQVTSSGHASIYVPDGREPRLAAWVVTERLAVATVHLSNEPKALPRSQVRPALDSLPDEVTLIAGDLNCRPARRYGAWQRVNNNGRRISWTYPASRPRQAIDHVLTTQPGNVASTRLLRVSGSDHLPILVEWRPSGSTAR